MSDERAEFEKCYRSEFKRECSDWFEQGNRYFYGHTQDCWETWQASARVTRERIAKEIRMQHHMTLRGLADAVEKGEIG